MSHDKNDIEAARAGISAEVTERLSRLLTGAKKTFDNAGQLFRKPMLCLRSAASRVPCVATDFARGTFQG